MINFYNINNKNGDSNGQLNILQKANPKKAVFTRYSSAPDELTGRELKLGLWFARNKVLLYKILIGSLIGLNIIFWVFSLWKWGDFLIFGITENTKLAQSATQFVNYTGIQAHFSPQPLQIITTQFFNSGPGKVDVVAEVANLNDRFVVRFDYYFMINGQKTDVNAGILLPGEDKPVAVLGLEDSVFSGTPELVLENLKWTRISSHDVKDVPSWQGERLNFAVSDVKFIRKGSEEGVAAAAIQFKLTNQGPYGFVNPKFYVGLYQGQAMVGVLPLELQRFHSQQIVDVDLRSFATNISVTDIKVFPLIDIYDPAVYMEPER